MPVFSPPAILAFANALFTPRLDSKAKPGARAKYSCNLVFLKDVDLTELKKAALGAAVEALGRDKVATMLRDNDLKMPWRTDKIEKYGFPAETQAWIRIWSYEKPGIVSTYRGPDGKALPITDPGLIYSGIKVRASLRPYYFDNESKGINFGLGNIQKIGDGDRMDGRANAQDEFEATEDAPANLADLSEPQGNARPPSGGGKDDLSDLLG